MLSRHEEKYILDYRQYLMLRQRASQVLMPDPHGENGRYVITSVYFDDPMDTALDEKLDGLQEHRKFRIRTYDCTDRFIKLERKDKQGIMTQKLAASVRRESLGGIFDGCQPDGFTGTARELVIQMRARALRPVIAVRYCRDAFYHLGSDFRLTFDTDLEAIRPDAQALFSAELRGLPVMPGSVIMEIKYGACLPAFVRKLTNVNCKQLSVSKYALCRGGD